MLLKTKGADAPYGNRQEVIMKSTTKNLCSCLSALLIAVSFIAEYLYCFDGWLTDPGSSYMFMILCVGVQAVCAEFICFSLGVRHMRVAMLAASLGSGVIFSGMLFLNLYVTMDSNAAAVHSATVFNMLPIVTGAVLLAFQLMFTGFSGGMKLRTER